MFRFSTVCAEQNGSRVQRASSTCLRFNALNEPLARPIPPAVCAHILARGHAVRRRRRCDVMSRASPSYMSFLRLAGVGVPRCRFCVQTKEQNASLYLRFIRRDASGKQENFTLFVIVQLPRDTSNLNQIRVWNLTGSNLDVKLLSKDWRTLEKILRIQIKYWGKEGRERRSSFLFFFFPNI